MSTNQVGMTKRNRFVLTTMLAVLAVAWMVPLATAIYSSFRDYRSDTLKNGVFSLPTRLTLDNYRGAFKQADLWRHLGNTMFITIPAMILILFFSSLVAYACTRYSWKFNVFFLILFTMGNLMPAQVIFQPLFRIFLNTKWPDVLSDTDTGSLLGTKVAVIFIHVAFQTGFCTFVLSNYMKTIPKELGEAALVDGASVWRQYWQIILPLCRPAFAALATLEFTWLYNDFFWGNVMLNQGAEKPITASILQLSGQYFSDYNLVAAASLLIALPTVIIYFALQKHFISGLTLGANKG